MSDTSDMDLVREYARRNSEGAFRELVHRHINDDVGEKVNVEASNEQVVTNLENLLEKYVVDGRSTPGPPQANDVPVNIWKRGRNQADSFVIPPGVPAVASTDGNNPSPYKDPPASDPTFGN